MGEGAVGPVGEDLLGLGVAAVVLLGLDIVNGESVKTAWWRQAVNSSPWPWAAWRLRSLTRRTIRRAVMAWARFEVKAVYCTSATWASEIQQPELVIPDGAGIADRGPGLLGDGGDRGADLGVHAHGDGEIALRPAGGPDRRGAVESRVHPHHQRAGAPGGAGSARPPR